MTFQKLAEYFAQLELTSSRNAMVEILSRLFGEAEASEIDKVVYLTQGRVAPLYEPVEFGMAEKMILRALELAFGVGVGKATEIFKKNGDLGEAARDLSNKINKNKKNNKKTVTEVFMELLRIAQSGGEGSVEKKIGILSGLLQESDPLSAKYIARIPVDKMRLGFSDMTVLEGLSWMMDKTKGNKPAMEAVYNIRPDLGYIAKQVRAVIKAGKKQALASIEEIKPVTGTPLLPMRAERAASPDDILENTGGRCAIEPKVDGLRTQLHIKRAQRWGLKAGSCEVRLYSRGLENVTGMYPDLVAAAEKEIACEDVILDGEAIGYNPQSGKFLPFQETVQRKRKYDIESFSKNVPLKLIVFDCLYLNGRSLINEPYTVRRKEVEKLLRKENTIQPAEMHIVNDAAEIEKLFHAALAKNLEGIMAKKLDGVYQAGARGWNWIKYKKSYESKLADTIDAVVMGYDYGQGKRSKFGVGAFLVGVYDKKEDSFKTISKIGTGLTDEEWQELAARGKGLAVSEKPKNYNVNKTMGCDVWLRPKLVGEFKADELTKSPMHTAGLALRFPRLVRWREKNPEDTTSTKEMEAIFKLQAK